MSPDRPATIYDVARAAGVSHQTVTRFLNGFEGIRPATRERVEHALAELDYRPNQAARLLRTKRSNRIGALAHEMTKNGPASVVRGASLQAHDRGYVLDIVILDGFDERSVLDALAVLEREHVAGIFAPAQTPRMRTAFESLPLTVPILIGSHIDSDAPEGHGFQIEAGRFAAEHLLSLGHRRMLTVTGPLEASAPRERLEGFMFEIAGHGASVEVVEGDWSPDSGYAAGVALAADAGYTAVFAQNDHMALGVIRALSERGIRVPDDVSVVGVDDIPESKFLTPPLTTVRLDFEAEGRFAMDWLISQIEGSTPPGRELIPQPQLIVRESTSPAYRA